MNRKLMVVPTIILLLSWLFGIYLHTQVGRIGMDWMAFSFTGLVLYTVIATFISCLVDAYQGKHQYSVREKWVYGYMCSLSVLLIILAIYWMAHN